MLCHSYIFVMLLELTFATFFWKFYHLWFFTGVYFATFTAGKCGITLVGFFAYTVTTMRPQGFQSTVVLHAHLLTLYSPETAQKTDNIGDCWAKPPRGTMILHSEGGGGAVPCGGDISSFRKGDEAPDT